jgi:hypothetical protein
MFMNLTLLCLFIDAAIAVIAIRRTTIASPISVFTSFNFLCLLYFYFTVDLDIRPAVKLSAMPIDGLKPYSRQTALFYVMLNIAALAAIFSTPKIGKQDFAQMAARFKFFLSTQSIGVFLAILGLISLVHVADFDLSYFWSYRGYHAINEADAVGISNPISGLYHRIGPALASLALSVAVICYHTGRRFFILPAIILGCYGFALSIASSSREMSMFFIIPAFTHYFFRKKIDTLSVAGFVMGAIAILFATITRGKYADLGFQHLGENLAAMEIGSLPQAVLSLLSNVAQGAIDYGHAVGIAPEYPFVFIWVSMFSPLPSSIDGWETVRDQYLIKINRPNPISALAETFHFGWAYFTLFLSVVLVLLRSATIQMFRHTSLMTLPIYGFTILLIYRIHHYPTRISQRLILILLIFYAIDYGLRRFTAHKNKRAAQLAQARMQARARPPRIIPASTANG